MRNYLLHGSRHGPQGSDPIPGASSAAMWQTAYTVPLFAIASERSNRTDGSLTATWSNVKIPADVEVPHNAVMNNYQDDLGGGGARTALNGDEFVFGMRMGPKGSRWNVAVGYIQGPAYGRINIQVATLPEVSSSDVANAPTGWIDYIDDAVWVDPGFSYLDAYAASNGVARSVSLWDFSIGGDDGDPLTSFVTSTSTVGDGGAGIWMWRMYVDGKNASSSGYKAAIWELTVFRENRRVDDTPVA